MPSSNCAPEIHTYAHSFPPPVLLMLCIHACMCVCVYVCVVPLPSALHRTHGQGDCNHWVPLLGYFNTFYMIEVQSRGDVLLSMKDATVLPKEDAAAEMDLARKIVKILDTTVIILENCTSLHVYPSPEVRLCVCLPIRMCVCAFS